MNQIVIDMNSELPPLRALHGVNNGPIGYGGLVDVSHYYRAAEIPLVRLHDPNWPHPREVDIPQVFPDFEREPSDPASYRFERTDDYLRRITDTGARIVYRLGVSIENSPRKYYTAPPADFKKWAAIAAGIVRHYNHGWADGQRLGIPYWEIWNEPELGPQMWSGTYEQYLDLYAHAAPAVKAADPSAKVGGPALVNCRSGHLERFLSFCRDRRLPLDFVSWHGYRRNPVDYLNEGIHVRQLMARYGFDRAESHLNEWNYVDFDWNTVFVKGSEVARRESFERQKNEVGASFTAAALMLMQDAGVDAACYYDGQPSALFCGLFDYYGVPQKTFYTFQAFSRLLKYSRRLKVDRESDGPVAVACAGKPGELALLVSNFSEQPWRGRLVINGAEAGNRSLTAAWIDHERNLSGGPIAESLDMPPHSVAFINSIS